MSQHNENRRKGIIEQSRNIIEKVLQLATMKAVEENARVHIQDLLDSRIDVEEFANRIGGSLGLILDRKIIDGLKLVVPLLRSAHLTRELIIEGINPPVTGNEPNTV